ncbi:MAG TPA: hypothetical protein VIV63_03145 [Steroidobacteraceae bacterium]
MNYGPLEFANYLRRIDESQKDSATVEAARSAAPTTHPANRLTIVSGGTLLTRVTRASQVEAVSVYEAVAVQAPGESGAGAVAVLVRATLRPVVLVLSSHQTVHWHLALAPGAVLRAVLLSGYGESTVTGTGDAQVHSIGGFYAFRQGSAEFRHLEAEVLRCTGRPIETFRSVYAGRSFEIGDD